MTILRDLKPPASQWEATTACSGLCRLTQDRLGFSAQLPPPTDCEPVEIRGPVLHCPSFSTDVLGYSPQSRTVIPLKGKSNHVFSLLKTKTLNKIQCSRSYLQWPVQSGPWLTWSPHLSVPYTLPLWPSHSGLSYVPWACQAGCCLRALGLDVPWSAGISPKQPWLIPTLAQVAPHQGWLPPVHHPNTLLYVSLLISIFL